MQKIREGISWLLVGAALYGLAVMFTGVVADAPIAAWAWFNGFCVTSVKGIVLLWEDRVR